MVIDVAFKYVIYFAFIDQSNYKYFVMIILQTMFFTLFPGNVNEDIALVSQQHRCNSQLSGITHVSSIADCVAVCHGVSPVFSMGQGGSGRRICNSNGKCECRCEQGSNVDGTCEFYSDKYFKMYKYARQGKSFKSLRDIGLLNLQIFKSAKICRE